MLPNDIIVLVCNYVKNSNYYLLNKETYNSVIQEEKSIYWKQYYELFFKVLGKEYLILNGDYNWKREYMRVKRFNKWQLIQNKSKLYLNNYEIKEVPKEIGNLSNLQKLFLNNNEITEIPKEICNLTNLRHLYLDCNKITEIPQEICNLTGLQYLDLSENKITKIQKEIGYLPYLIHLGISDNKIMEIPTELQKKLDIDI